MSGRVDNARQLDYAKGGRALYTHQSARELLVDNLSISFYDAVLADSKAVLLDDRKGMMCNANSDHGSGKASCSNSNAYGRMFHGMGLVRPATRSASSRLAGNAVLKCPG